MSDTRDAFARARAAEYRRLIWAAEFVRVVVDDNCEHGLLCAQLPHDGSERALTLRCHSECEDKARAMIARARARGTRNEMAAHPNSEPSE